MLTFGRDYTQSAVDTRQLERGQPAPRHNGDTLLGWPEFQQGKVAVIFSTLFVAPIRHQHGEWDTQVYQTDAEAHIRFTAQLDAYHRLVEQHPDKFQILSTKGDLEHLLADWDSAEKASHPVGFVILMESAEGVRSVDELEQWWTRGVRIIGPAWSGTRFCGGTGEPGPLTKEGFQLLEGMASYGFVLDLSHMDELAARQALDGYPGTVIASHANASSLLKGLESNRFLKDEVLANLLERDGVIGVVPFNRFLLPGWQSSDGRQAVTLDLVIAQIDYICQMAGDAQHVAIGSDFDGGFGLNSVPIEIDTIADLTKIPPLLAQKGYTDEDIAAVMGQNWLRILSENLPESI
jgi:membrane dipeptidase